MDQTVVKLCKLDILIYKLKGFANINVILIIVILAHILLTYVYVTYPLQIKGHHKLKKMSSVENKRQAEQYFKLKN